MKKIARVIVLTSCTGLALPAQSANINFFSDLSSWQSAVDASTLNLSVSTFETNHANVSNESNVGSFSALDANYGNGCSNSSTSGCQRMNTGYSGNNVDLGTAATFNSADTGFQWSFELTTFQTKGNEQATFYYNDIPAGKTFEQTDAFTDVLSVGKFNGFIPNPDESDDWANDNFTVEITGGSDLYAFGFYLINNKHSSPDNLNEWLEVFASQADSGTSFNNTGDNALALFGDSEIPGYSGSYGSNFDDVRFVGIVSDTAFSWLEFNEDNGANDIGLKDFYFAGVTPVPLPAGIWLFGTGVLALFGAVRKRERG